MEKARTETEWLDIENRAQERTRAKLDEEIAGKGSWADRESGNTILSGLTNIAGRGRYAKSRTGIQIGSILAKGERTAAESVYQTGGS